MTTPKTFATRKRWEMREAIQRSTFICYTTCVHGEELFGVCDACDQDVALSSSEPVL